MISITPTITIRDIESVAQMKALEKLQQDVWGWDDLDTTPLMDFIILKELGGTLIGAFDDEHLIGFAFGFVGWHEERVVFNSHILAVHPSYREHGIGLRLKLAQRASAIERGFTHITWTFDPLQSTNGHLNFRKLGVVASKYKVNFYGEQSSSPLHRYIGTDRLWVDWFLDSKRVKNRVNAAQEMNDGVIANVDGLDGLIIEVPDKIASVQRSDPEAARTWRDSTRAAFINALRAGYVVDDFFRVDRNGNRISCYLLVPRTLANLE
jgi:predicted GNAT superfamily acetyltransferase